MFHACRIELYCILSIISTYQYKFHHKTIVQMHRSLDTCPGSMFNFPHSSPDSRESWSDNKYVRFSQPDIIVHKLEILAVQLAVCRRRLVAYVWVSTLGTMYVLPWCPLLWKLNWDPMIWTNQPITSPKIAKYYKNELWSTFLNVFFFYFCLLTWFCRFEVKQY